MDRVEKKLQKVIYAFVMSVIIIVAAFAVTIYYYETKESPGARVVEGLFAMAFVDESVGSIPLNTSFSALLFNFEGTPTYHWEFGDGNTSNEANPAYNYTETGEYTCNLTVTDVTGKIVTTSIKILAMANEAPTVVSLVSQTQSPRPSNPFWLIKLNQIKFVGDKILAALAQSDSPLTKEEGWITCEAQVSDQEGDEIVWYEWVLQQPTVYNITGTQYWPKFTFTGENLTTITFPKLYTFRTGQYDVKVTVTDSEGNKASDIKRFNVGISSLEGQINALKGSWNGLWGAQFQYKPDFVKNIIHPAVWKLLGPIHNATDDMVDKIVGSLPESIKSAVYQAYGLIWDSTEKKYHMPNWGAPTVPSDPYPAEGASGIALNATLSWNCSDPDGDGIKYDVYLGTNTLGLVALEQGSANYSPIGLLENTTYYWYVVAKDSPGTGGSMTTYGPLWNFTTEG